MRALALLLLLTGAAAPPHFLGKPPREVPRRIVTLAPSITEMVIALGQARKVVGVTRYDDAPEVRRAQRVGGFLDPAPEAVLALEPDLVIAQPSPGNRGPVQQLAKLGVPVLVTPLQSVEEILASLRAVGRALGEASAAEAVVAHIEQGLADVRARTASLPPRRVLVVYGWQPLVVAGPASFADALIAAAGGVNAAAGASGPYPVLSAEAALAAAPDVVVDASGASHGAGTGATHGAGVPPPGLEGRVRALQSDALVRPGPRLEEGVRELARVLHPAAFAPSTGKP